MLNWTEIDTVLLDMDGTLLDLHFDTHFWLEFLPKELAKKRNISVADATDTLINYYKEVEGQIEWYCLDYWQKKLDLPIMPLKHELKHLISMRDDVPEFLTYLKSQSKQLILLTNAHPNSLSLKVERTNLDKYLDELISTHEYGVSKESQLLWHKVQQRLQFNPERTLFVDDSLAVLDAAKEYGIGHILAIANPDSNKPENVISDYLSTTDYRTLIPTSN